MPTKSDRHLTGLRDWLNGLPFSALQALLVWVWWPDGGPGPLRSMTAGLSAFVILAGFAVLRGYLRAIGLGPRESRMALLLAMAIAISPLVVVLGLRPGPEMPALNISASPVDQPLEWRTVHAGTATRFSVPLLVENKSDIDAKMILADTSFAVVGLGDDSIGGELRVDLQNRETFVSREGHVVVQADILVPGPVYNGITVADAIKAGRISMEIWVKVYYGRSDSTRRPKWRTLTFLVDQDGDLRELERDGN